MTLGHYLCEYESLKGLVRIAEALQNLSTDWLQKRLTEDDYSFLHRYLHEKQKAARELDTVAVRVPHIAEASRRAGFVSFFPPKRPQPKSPDYEASQERRKLLASLGGLPAQLARKFTTAKQAVLKIVGDEVKRKGSCSLFLGEIAARAGCSMTWARATLHEAAMMGLIAIQERRQHRRPNKSNVIRIISAEWREWIDSKRYFMADMLGWVARTLAPKAKVEGGASTKVESTDKDFSNPSGRAASRPCIVGYQPPS